MIIFAVGDIVGWPGIKTFSKLHREIARTDNVGMTIVNGENASGIGITPQQADELFHAGADVITLGNHTWARREIIPYIDESPDIIRPANFPAQLPGMGYRILPTPEGRIAVINLIGRALMDVGPDNPFTTIDLLLERLKGKADAVAVDFHAEATSEKLAMLYHLAGRATVLFGTHTHVQTADEQVVDGTGYITDLGMTGPTRSVLGVKPEQSVAMFRGDMREKFETADGPTMLSGALFDVDMSAGRCRSVRRISLDLPAASAR